MSEAPCLLSNQRAHVVADAKTDGPGQGAERRVFFGTKSDLDAVISRRVRAGIE
jgi:hypothetical protein